MAEPSVAGSEPPALVFGGDVTALAVLRACGRNHLPVYVAGGSHRLVGRSRWFRVPPGGEVGDTADERELGEYLRTLPFERSVLFPCSDRWALAASSLPEDVAATHVPAVAPASVINAVVDKVLFARAVADAGVAAPRVLQAGELDALGADELSSFFVKPKLSQPFSERFGVKAIALETRRQAAELLRNCAEAGTEVFLQEYVPGPASSHVFLDGYVDREGAMRACLARRRLRMHPRRFGNSTLTVTIPLPDVSEALGALRRLFESLGYRGLFDAEFKLDARDGRFKILEVNARPWWQLGLAPSVGVDLCVLAYRDALGQPLPRVDGYRVGETWVHPVPDLQAWWRARRTENDGAGFPLRFWFTGANAVCSRDDPKPALEELGRAAARCLRLLERDRDALGRRGQHLAVAGLRQHAPDELERGR